MPTVPSFYTNQFVQAPVIGLLDLQIARGGGALAMQISANQATALKAGARVKIDGTVTSTGGLPQVVGAADNEDGIGVIRYDVKQTSFSAGDSVDVVCNLGPVMYLVAAATIAAGAKVEMSSGFVQTKNTGTTFGIALDPGVLNGFVRVAILSPLQA